MINWANNTLTFRKGRKLITEVANETLPRRKPECNSILISKHQIARTGPMAELFTVYLANTENETKTHVEVAVPEVTKILKEFPDIFSAALPDHLPPSRKLDHAIDLVPGAVPPSRLIYRCYQRK